MPRSRNPETGFIVTANNRIANEDYPHYIGADYDGEHRARCIYDALGEISSATVEDMAAVHALRASVPARELCPLLKNVEPRSAAAAQAKRLLLNWDCSMDKGRIEPTIFSAFHDALATIHAKSLLGSLADEMTGEAGRGAPAWYARTKSGLHIRIKSGPEEAANPILAEALETAVENLRSWLGEDIQAWTWGRVHRTNPRHALSTALPHLSPILDPPSVGAHGDGFTPLAGSYSPTEPFVITSASMARYVFDVSNWDNSRWIVPLGASGHPRSRHYSDQSEVWADASLIPMLYDWARISEEAETQQSLLPSTI